MSATNIRPSTKLKKIIELISWIPLISYKIKDGDLDTRYSTPESCRPYTITVRRIMKRLKQLSDKSNELNNLDYFSKCSLEHCMGTVKHYENDEDVRSLLENPILNNLAFQSDRDE